MILRPYQQKNVNEILACLQRGVDPLYVLPTGGGKCLGRGTPVLMFDGSVKAVEDVRVGDQLMGPDSCPRAVLSVCRGHDRLYRVTPKKGDAYVVNEAHILSLKMTGGAKMGGYAKGDVINLTVPQYLGSSKTFRRCAKGWRTGVEFPARPVPTELPPYFLGLWLADGHLRDDGVAISDQHPEVVAYLREFAPTVGLAAIPVTSESRATFWRLGRRTGRAGGGRGRQDNLVLNALRSFGLTEGRHIPLPYRANSRAARLELLAGLIDGDGHLTEHGGYDFIVKDRRLANDVAYLARSLGFSAYRSVRRKVCTNAGTVGDYHAVHISGDLQQVPVLKPDRRAPVRRQIKDVLVTGISIEAIGMGDYFGFVLDGDHLFLLGDFTVTHNTTVFTNVIGTVVAQGWTAGVFVHRKELLQQASARLTAEGVPHGIIAPGHDLTSHPVHVASIDTVGARLDSLTPWLKTLDLGIPDEAHHAVANKWERALSLLPRRFGVTATPCRTDGKGIGETGLFGTLVQGPSIADLTRAGYLAAAHVYAPPTGLDLGRVAKRGGDYVLGQIAVLTDTDELTALARRWYAKLCPGQPAVVFCTTVEHARHVAEGFAAAGWRARSVDGSMSADERDSAIGGLADGSVDVLTSCELIGEGLDIPAVAAAILLRPTASTGLYLQQVGRALRPHEDKSHATVIDLVGNTARHGMYDTARQWDLQGGIKGLKRAVAGTWRCSKCHRVRSQPAQAGKYACDCGHVQTVRGFNPPAIENHGPIAGIPADVLLSMKWKDVLAVLKTYGDLVAFGRLRHLAHPDKMKNPEGWARAVLEQRQQYRAKFSRGARGW